MAWVRRHLHSWDLTGIADRQHKSVVQGALNACDYPFGRIRKRTGKRVPVTVSDLSRFLRDREDVGATHAHVHEGGDHGHMLMEPEYRDAALGLYWLPTTAYPAGRVELDITIMADVPLAQEVFLAEAAHAVDYGVPLTDAQRQDILTVLHHGDATPHGVHGWWEERGGQNYWSDWGGENFMALFMGAFAPGLPRPLEARQPWAHRTTPEMFPKVREICLR